MNTQLEVVKQLPLNELQSISKTFYESGLFTNTKSAASAMVCIMAGQEVGIPPFAAISGIHIIQGKPVLGAGLIASRIKGSGKYDYKVKEMTDKNCSIDFYQGSEMIGNSAFSIDDAKKAGTKNIDKFPKNMLFARAISNGVKWYCPDVFAGPVYVPDEMPQITEDVQHEVVEAVIDYTDVENQLRECTTLESLAATFKALPKEIAKKVVAVKDEMKVKLTPAPDPSTHHRATPVTTTSTFDQNAL